MQRSVRAKWDEKWFPVLLAADKRSDNAPHLFLMEPDSISQRALL